MEDYDVFLEMQNLKNKKTILIIEDDEKFISNNLLSSEIELIPIRLSYDLSSFSNEYIENTKQLFTFYYNENNSYYNELLRLKKHFVHYQRFPFIAYIPSEKKYSNLVNILRDLNIECVNDKKLFLNKINNDKKLILIDSDGTLKRSDGSISVRSKKAILKNKKIGNKIIICTARPRYQTIDIMKESGASEIIVSSNGSEIYDCDKKTILKSIFINKEDIYNLIKCAYLKDVRLILTADNFDYVTKEPRNSCQILLNEFEFMNQLKDIDIKQCMFIDKKNQIIYEIKETLKKNKNIRIVDEIREDDPYEEKWFSIANSNSSKGNALQFLSDYLSIPIKNTIAIGNDKNDISMFEKCGYSVAVSNSSKEIQCLTDFVTSSNDEDGVANVLETLL